MLNTWSQFCFFFLVFKFLLLLLAACLLAFYLHLLFLSESKFGWIVNVWFVIHTTQVVFINLTENPSHLTNNNSITGVLLTDLMTLGTSSSLFFVYFFPFRFYFFSVNASKSKFKKKEIVNQTANKRFLFSWCDRRFFRFKFFIWRLSSVLDWIKVCKIYREIELNFWAKISI